MDKKTIGIVVKNDYNDILYYENNFFIKIDINKKDEKNVIIRKKHMNEGVFSFIKKIYICMQKIFVDFLLCTKLEIRST